MRWQDEKETLSTLCLLFFRKAKTAREDIGSSFYVIKTEECLRRNTGLAKSDLDDQEFWENTL